MPVIGNSIAAARDELKSGRRYQAVAERERRGVSDATELFGAHETRDHATPNYCFVSG